MSDQKKPRLYGQTPWFNSAHQELARQLIALEKIVNYREPPPAGQCSFRYVYGQRPILISAPHGAAHTRSGHFKIEDEYTTALARYLAQETGAHVLFATHFASGDPNWDIESRYKRRLAEKIGKHDIGFVLDLHGMTNRYNIGLALGTINGRSTVNGEGVHLLNQLAANGFRQIDRAEAEQLQEPDFGTVELNHPKFTGGRRTHTITRFVSQTLGRSAVQLEICSSLRIVEREAHHPWPSTFYGEMTWIWRVIQALKSYLSDPALPAKDQHTP